MLARLGALVGLALLVLGPIAPASAERPRLLRNATSTFDRFLADPTHRQKRWMRAHYFQMRGYSPFFERNAFAWRPPPTSFAKNAYAIYNPSERDLLLAHPDWVLRDQLLRPLYIPHECDGESCAQYAADFGHPGWRGHWIAAARHTFASGLADDPRERGYIGFFIDDVNLEMRVSDGAGRPATPLDTRTLQPMTLDAWQGYMAAFMERIRAAFPAAQITHNPLWWLPHDDPEVQRQVAAADWIELERGFNDDGLVAGGGTFGYETFLAHVDWLHALGKKVVFEPYLDEIAEARYELANYFLVRETKDAIATAWRADPPTRAKRPWPGWSVNPGRPLAPRELGADGLWRRDFANGTAIVNPVGGAPTQVEFARPHTNLRGETATTFTLGERAGDVYVRR